MLTYKNRFFTIKNEDYMLTAMLWGSFLTLISLGILFIFFEFLEGIDIFALYFWVPTIAFALIGIFLAYHTMDIRILAGTIIALLVWIGFWNL